SAPAKPETKKATTKKSPSWTRTFSAALVEAGERDSRVVAVTAAMPSGTGVDAFGARFPARCFDVGIAEQHGVTFCAGLAAAGFRPFAAIYSTFLQRGYDQVVHDVAIQGLPVRFVLDRAGLVGADGCTHHGSFDLAYLCCLPGLVVMAPADGRDLRRMVEWQSRYDAGPSAVRFPRGEVTVDDYGGEFTADLDASSSLITDALTAGVGRVVRGDGGGGVVSAVAGDSAGFIGGDGDGDSDGDGAGDVAILSFGALLGEALGAADLLESEGVRCCVADARFARPLDVVLLRRLAEGSRLLVTLEDGAAGGFGSCVMHWLGGEGLGVSVLPCTLPDKFIRQATRDEQLTEAGLDARSLSRRILSRYRSL
ncbi:MAG: hypothetical protein MPJ52_03460, partial [Alphaproteobacteria bacterium]|nr:hypothetical protein [Alphaproteobacteria bacterium]